MNFKDYEASFITPQATLLKKFNAILKFLENQSFLTHKWYIHNLSITYTGGSGLVRFISTYPKSLTTTTGTTTEIDDILNDNIWILIPVKLRHCLTLIKSYSGTYYYISLTDAQAYSTVIGIASDTVEEFAL